MGKFILKRALSAIPVLFIILLMVFCLMRAIPGNPLYTIQADADMTDEQMQIMQEKYGLNGSIFEQFGRYLKNIAKGDWGTSYFNGEEVFKNIFAHMEPTLMMTGLSTLITLGLGIPIGIYCATHRNSWIDYAVSSASMLFTVIPSFCIGIVLLYVFAFVLDWFPLYGYTHIADGGFWNALRSIALPSFALGLSGMATFARHTRSQMLDVLQADYIRTARSKGLSEQLVNYRHALRSVLSIIITMVSGTVLGHLGGSSVLETVFNIPGVGLLAFESLTRKDYSQEQAILLFFAFMFVFMNIVLDIIYKLLDPRVELD